MNKPTLVNWSRILKFFLAVACISLSALAEGGGVSAKDQAAAYPAEKSAQSADLQGDEREWAKKYERAATARFSPGRPLADFEEDDFIGPALCFNCHHLLTDAAGNQVSIISHWRSTMMANAAKDPFWQAKVQSEIKRNPAIAEVIEQKCVVCHMPMAWNQSRVAAGYGQAAAFGKGFLNPANVYHEAAMDGVSCTLCHQIQDQGLGTKASFSGKVTIDTETEPPRRVIFGPYRDPVPEPMQTSVEYTPEYGPQMNDAALCATCHTLFTPYLDSAGKIAGEFPEQVAFLEWRHSDYNVPEAARYDIGENPGNGKICQECHMPHSPAGEVVIARWAPVQVKPKSHFSQHFFVGGNVFMLDILQDGVSFLGLSATTEEFEQTKGRTLDLLQDQGAELAILSSRRRKDILSTTVKVSNRAGHKFPTGFPSRRLWIHFVVLDREGRLVFESGRPMASGAISGNDNDENLQAYEPHYQEISRPEQVQIYEAIMSDSDRRLTYTLLRAATYLKDNRMLPAGFDKDTASRDIAVHGKAAVDDDFRGGSDSVVYRVNTQGFTGPLMVRAELLYSPLSYAFMADLDQDADLDAVARFRRLVARANKMPVLIASDSLWNQ
jgi:hypothetical protein